MTAMGGADMERLVRLQHKVAGLRARELRLRHGVALETAAVRLGTQVTDLEQWELGQSGYPLQALWSLLDYLDASEGDLMPVPAGGVEHTYAAAGALGVALRHSREAAGLSAQEAEAALGLAGGALLALERGEASLSMALAETLARLYSCQVSDWRTTPVEIVAHEGALADRAWRAAQALSRLDRAALDVLAEALAILRDGD